MWKSLVIAAALAVYTQAHGDDAHEQETIAGPLEKLWYNTLPGDGGTQVRRELLLEWDTMG